VLAPTFVEHPAAPLPLFLSFKLTGMLLTSGRGELPKKFELWQTYKEIILS